MTTAWLDEATFCWCDCWGHGACGTENYHTPHGNGTGVSEEVITRARGIEVARVHVLHVANPSLILGIPYGSQTPLGVKLECRAKSQPSTTGYDSGVAAPS